MTTTETKQLHQESLNKRPALLKQLTETAKTIVEDEKWVSNPTHVALTMQLRTLDRRISELGHETRNQERQTKQMKNPLKVHRLYEIALGQLRHKARALGGDAERVSKR